MRIMPIRAITILLIALSISLGGCASGRHPLLRTGEDAGYLVASVGEINGTNYEIVGVWFRKKGDSDPHAVLPFAYSSIPTKPAEDSMIGAYKLNPGEYEIYALSVGEGDYAKQPPFTPTKEFPAPLRVKFNDTMMGRFTNYWIDITPITVVVKPKVATYIGNYQAVSLGTRTGLFGKKYSTNGAYFVLSNEVEKDTARAKKIQPAIAEVINMTPAAQSIGSPYVRGKVLE